ncbi:MAG: ABC transporter substrate-binding protein [Flavobacteriales bacterium]
MKPFKRFLSFMMLSSLLFGCKGDGKDDQNGGAVEQAKGPPTYGDTLHIPQTERFQTLYPYGVTDLISSHVVSQMHEGLFKFDAKDMTVKKGLVKEHRTSKNGKVHRFTLKDSIYFHPDPCFKNKKERLIRTEDVKFSFELLCRPSQHNDSYKMTFKRRVKGAKELYQGKAQEISGFKKIDEQSFKIELTRPSNSFHYILSLPAASIISKKAFKEYGPDIKVGAGPFQFKTIKKDGEELVLERFKDYHMTDSLNNQLPYLDQVHFHFINSKVQQLEDFKREKVHMIHGLPADKVRSVVQEDIDQFTGDPPNFILSRVPEMSTQFYEFNLTKEIFQNIHVRKAFSYAINRDSIVKHVLEGEAYGPGNYGITPPTFDNYDIKKIDGYSFQPQKARKHLKKAGYPKGEGFPSIKIELNRGGGKNTRVAIAIQNQLEEVLNIHVDLEMVSFSKKLENAKKAKGGIWRSAWIADYPSPENFLWLAYGGQVPEDPKKTSWPNVTRYQNPRFDSLYLKGLTSQNQDSSYKYFRKAERIMMNDAPMIILWYGEKYRMIHSQVRNLHANPMKYYDLRRVYLKEREEGSMKGSPQASGKKKEKEGTGQRSEKESSASGAEQKSSDKGAEKGKSSSKKSKEKGA